MADETQGWHILFEGEGPFELPQMTDVISAIPQKDGSIHLEAEFEGQYRCWLPISNRAALLLWNVVGAAIQKTGKSDEQGH